MKRKKSMLLVDADPVIEQEIVQAFEDNYEIWTEATVQRAKGFLVQNGAGIDVVLLEPSLPCGDGACLLEYMGGNSVLRSVPVVIITDADNRNRESDLRHRGASDFLTKPIDLRLLALRVDNLVRLTEKDLDEQVDALHMQWQKEQQRHKIVLEQSRTYVVEVDYRENQVYIDPEMHNALNSAKLKIEPGKIPDFHAGVYIPDLPKMRAVLTFPMNMERKTLQAADVRMQTKRRTYEWFHVTSCLLRDERGKRERMIVTISNVHEDMLNRKQLEYMASRDLLTRIPNRDTFTRQAREMLDAHEETTFVMVRLDIERFRVVGQLFGHEEGDRMLRFIAVKLQESVESFEFGCYCRLASDVFAACIPYCSENVRELMDYIQHSASEYPVDYQFVLAFGLYVIDEPDLSINTMLDRAAQAQKTVKGSVLRHEAYYDEKLKEQDIIEQMILAEMNTALEQEQFLVYMQPKCRMDTGEIVGSEALVRWKHPEKGMISPGVFIPLFERNGFITQLDTYVWEKTCAYIRKWLDAGYDVKPVSVNISRVDLYNPRLKEVILGLVKKYGIPKRLLELELTESSFVSDERQLRNLSRDMQQEGFHVLMDDFGSGYSSLNSLKDLCVDQLKLDLRFLEASENDDKSGSILASIVRMAKLLGLSIVAEGVETLEQAVFLQSIGCFVAQGYYFYRPMPTGDFERLLEVKETAPTAHTEQMAGELSFKSILSANTAATALFNLMIDSVGIYELSDKGLEIVRFNDGHVTLMKSTRERVAQHCQDVLTYVQAEKRLPLLDLLNSCTSPTEIKSMCLCLHAPNISVWVRAKVRFLVRQDDRSLFLITLTNINHEIELEEKLRQLEVEKGNT